MISGGTGVSGRYSNGGEGLICESGFLETARLDGLLTALEDGQGVLALPDKADEILGVLPSVGLALISCRKGKFPTLAVDVSVPLVLAEAAGEVLRW